MYTLRKDQTGFTLIEALIAFIVMTVGILGSLLFHSQLIAESGSNKTKLEAVRIAEQYIEDIRAVSATSKDAYETALSSAVASLPPSITGVNANYSVTSSYSSGADPSGADLYNVSVALTWEEPVSGSIELQSMFAFINPVDQLEKDEAGSGGNAEYNSDTIKVPTGTAKKLNRTVSTAYNIFGVASVAAGTVSTAGKTVYVAIEDGTSVVDLIELASENDKFVRIFGQIEENKTNDPGDGFLFSSDIEFRYLSSVDGAEGYLDVDSLAGAGCVIYAIGVKDSRDFAKYICVAGQGWNGVVSLQVRDGPSKNNSSKLDFETCLNNNRAYKYLIVANTVSGSEISSSTPISDLEIKGQSGVVSFEAGSGYNVNDYFWHNPLYLVSSAYSPYLLGDIVDQNFVVDVGSNVDCSTSVDYSTRSEWSLPYTQTVMSSGDSIIEEAWPGEPADIGDPNYSSIVTGSVSWAKYSYKGDVILGYAPYRNVITGNAYLSSPLNDTDIQIIGQPEPLVSITCDLQVSAPLITSGAYTAYTYECPVPENWTGYIIGMPVYAELATSTAEFSIESFIPAGEEVPVKPTDISGNVIEIDGTADGGGRRLGQCLGDDVAWQPEDSKLEVNIGPDIYFTYNVAPVTSGEECELQFSDFDPVP